MGSAMEKLIALTLVHEHKMVTHTGKVVTVKEHSDKRVAGLLWKPGLAAQPGVQRARNANWDKTPVVEVPLDNIHASHDGVKSSSKLEGDIPKVLIKDDGKHVVIHGHTRTAAHIAHGHKTMLAHVIHEGDDLDSRDNTSMVRKSQHSDTPSDYIEHKEAGAGRKRHVKLSGNPALDALTLAHIGNYERLFQGRRIQVHGYDRLTEDWSKHGDKIKARDLSMGHVFQYEGIKVLSTSKATHVPPAPFAQGHFRDSGKHHIEGYKLDDAGRPTSDYVSWDAPSDATVFLEPGFAKGRLAEAAALGTKKHIHPPRRGAGGADWGQQSDRIRAQWRGTGTGH